MAQLTIDERFRGPPESANGGYTCGLVARALGGPAEVTLRAPPPLGRALELLPRDQGLALLDGENLIAEARRAEVEVEVPDPVSTAAARDATAGYPWRERHAYPTCFVCGPEREAGDGLAIFPGPVEGRPVYASPWTPDRSLADTDGVVRDEFVWAALDCPSGVATELFGEIGLMLLGRLTADLRRPVEAGAEHVVQAWAIDRDGRKLNTASALFTPEGELCAAARAVWIELAS